MFRVWDVPDSRATRDIDFLAYVDNSPENLAAIFREVYTTDDADDGLVFDPDTVDAKRTPETRCAQRAVTAIQAILTHGSSGHVTELCQFIE